MRTTHRYSFVKKVGRLLQHLDVWHTIQEVSGYVECALFCSFFGDIIERLLHCKVDSSSMVQ